jgi:poly-gamma-glutamate system protein
MGGKRDIQLKKSDDERILIKSIVRRNGIPLIYEENLNDSVKKRMEIYREQAGEKPIKAFVNVGGGVAALGKYKYRKYYPTGAFFDIPVENFPKKGVMRLMIESGVPVINVRNINYYVKEYGVVTPEGERQSLGKGKLFLGWKFHVLIAAGALAGIIIIFALAVLFDGYILPGLKSRFSRRRD